MNVSKSTQLRPWRRALVLIAVLSFAFAPSAHAGNFPRLVIFGDSLSDAGNHFIAFGTTSLAPFMPIPDASYDIGGHHFSNGATWAEQLTQALGLPTSGSPALRAPGVFTSYAVGRARARAGAPVFSSFDLSTQVGRFLTDFGGQAASESLYVIWIGANDLEDALDGLPSDPSPIIGAAIAATANNILALYGFGARTFLIPNLPNFANTPAVRAAGPLAQFYATLLTNAYNGALNQALTSLQGLPGIHIILLDDNGLLDDIVAAPQDFGLTDAENSCLTFFVTGHVICATANRHLFWDGIHPTTAGHAILAGAARQAIADP